MFGRLWEESPANKKGNGYCSDIQTMQNNQEINLFVHNKRFSFPRLSRLNNNVLHGNHMKERYDEILQLR